VHLFAADRSEDRFHNQKIDLPKLPRAEGAAFDSHQDEHDARCLENTRVDLQRQIAGLRTPAASAYSG
jgi:hypothetical protein